MKPRSRMGRLSRSVATAWHWRTDPKLRKRIGQIAHLMTGNVAGTILSLMAVAITARALGPASYGMLALTISFGRVLERLFSFQSWQTIIRYGAGLSTDIGRDDLKSLLKFGFILDLAAGAVAYLVALAAAWLATLWFGWSRATFELTAIYCTVLLFNLPGMPTAVLRLSGHFRSMAYGQAVSAALRLALCAVAVVHGADVATFTMIWAGTQIVASLVLLATAARQLRRQGLTGLHHTKLRGVAQRFPGLWRYTWSTNLALTLRSSANQFDTLIVGWLAGTAAAGLYHLAKQLGKAAQQFGGQVQAVLYPDIARMWATGDHAAFRRAVVQVEVILAVAGIAGLVLTAVLAEPVLRTVAGTEFSGAAPLLMVQMIAVVFVLSGSAAHSALMAMGKAAQALNITLLATVAFHSTALLLVPRIGAMGANIAHVILGTIWVTGLVLALRRGLASANTAAGDMQEGAKA